MCKLQPCRSVEHVPLYSVAEYIHGIQYNRADEGDGICVLRANNILDARLNLTELKRVKSTVKAEQLLHSGDLLICTANGSGAHIGKVAYIDRDLECTFGTFMGVLRVKERLDGRYLFHILNSSRFRRYIKDLDSSTIKNLSKRRILNFKIPLPDRIVQEKIVQKLELLINLISELKKRNNQELKARERQLEFYKKVVLHKHGKRYKIGELCDIFRGKILSEKYITENRGQYPVYSSQTSNNGELGRISRYNYDGEYISWTTDGCNAGTLFYRSGKFSVTNVCGLLKVKNSSILTKYLYYALSLNVKKYVNRVVANHKLMNSTMSQIDVWLPPLSVQKKIIAILEPLESKYLEMKKLLALELELRYRQYREYSDRLLAI